MTHPLYTLHPQVPQKISQTAGSSSPSYQTLRSNRHRNYSSPHPTKIKAALTLRTKCFLSPVSHIRGNTILPLTKVLGVILHPPISSAESVFFTEVYSTISAYPQQQHLMTSSNATPMLTHHSSSESWQGLLQRALIWLFCNPFSANKIR